MGRGWVGKRRVGRGEEENEEEERGGEGREVRRDSPKVTLGAKNVRRADEVREGGRGGGTSDGGSINKGDGNVIYCWHHL